MSYSVRDHVYLKTGLSEAVKIDNVIEQDGSLKYVVSRSDGHTDKVVEEDILCKATFFPRGNFAPTEFREGDVVSVVSHDEAKALFNGVVTRPVSLYCGKQAVIWMAEPLRGCYIVDCEGDRVCLHESLLKRS